MSGAARRRHFRDEELSDSSSQRSQLQVPIAFDGPASRGGSSVPAGSAGSGRRPSNAGSNQPSRAPSNAGSNVAPRSPNRSPAVSPRMGQGGFGSMAGSGPPSARAVSAPGGIAQDPALDVQRKLTDICRNIDLPAWAYNLDHLVSLPPFPIPRCQLQERRSVCFSLSFLTASCTPKCIEVHTVHVSVCLWEPDHYGSSPP